MIGSLGGVGGGGIHGPLTKGTGTVESWVPFGAPVSSASSTYTAVANTIYGVYGTVPEACTLEGLAIYVNATIPASSVRVGVYATGGLDSPWPLGLLLDAGALATTAGGWVQVTGLSLPMVPGVLYSGALLFSHTPGIRVYSNDMKSYPVWGWANTLTGYGGPMVSATQAFGALPTPFPVAARAVVRNFNTPIFLYARFV